MGSEEDAMGLLTIIKKVRRKEREMRRLQDCHDELHSLLCQEKLAGATLLVFANKQDLPGAKSAEEIQQILELDKLEGRHWHIRPCSAVTGEGLEAGVGWMVDDIQSRIYMY